MAAVTAECHPKLVDMVIEARRNHAKGKGKKIMSFLIGAAEINIKAYTEKEKLANKLQTEI